jgi:hypothetical protein
MSIALTQVRDIFKSLETGDGGLMLGHLESAIPGQRASQGCRKFANMFAQCRHNHRRMARTAILKGFSSVTRRPFFPTW